VKLTFEIPPYKVNVSSHGQFTVWVKSIPSSVHSTVLPGAIFRAKCDVLNETWSSEGREPLHIEPYDDGMPDLEDPRLERCVRDYIQLHHDELARLHQAAAEKWEELKMVHQLVEGRLISPGQPVNLLHSANGEHASAVSKGTFEFAGIEGNRVFLHSPQGTFNVVLGQQRSGRSWVVPSGIEGESDYRKE
jgi:hypothetical protein